MIKIIGKLGIDKKFLNLIKNILSTCLMHPTWAGQGWYTGKTQRDGMGNTCKSMADSCKCMAKTIQYCKVISLQLIKINEKKSVFFEKK